MGKWRHIFSFGLRRKVFFTVLLGILLSIGITTYINSVTISKEITATTAEKMKIISEKSRQIIAEEVDNQIGFLKSIAIVSGIKDVIRESNQSGSAMDFKTLQKQNQNIDQAWSNLDPAAEKLIQKILSNVSSEYLRNLQAAYQENVEIFITDQFGRNIAMTNRTTDYIQSDEEWWLEAFSGHIYTSTPIFDQSTETWAIYISVPVFDEGFGGKIIGVVRGTVDLTSIFNTIFNIQFGDSGKGVFLSQDGMLYQLTEDNLSVEKAPEELLRFVQQNSNNQVRIIEFEKNPPIIIATNSISRPGQSLGWIVIFLEEQEIQALFNEAIQKNILVAALLIIVLGGISLFLANNITYVFRTLEKDAHHIAVGDYKQTFSKNLETSNDPHIISLVYSFNQMKTAIQTREKTIRESEKKYRVLVETMGEGLVMVNQFNLITYVNPKICELLGFSKLEMLNHNIEQYFESGEFQNIKETILTPEAKLKPSYESNLLKANGEYLPVLISPQRLSDEQGTISGILAVITDNSVRKNNELMLKRRLKELDGLRQIDMAILEKSSLPDVIETVLEQVKQRLYADTAVIYIFDQESQAFNFSGGFLLEKSINYNFQIPVEKILSRLSQNDSGIYHQENIKEFILCDQIKDLNLNSLFTVPIQIKGQIKGFIEIGFIKDIRLNEEWKGYLNAIVTQTAVGIDKIELLKNLQARNRDLRQAYDSAIMGWAKALELRDEETQGHSDRVVKLSLKLAKNYGFEGEELDNFRKGALLHDIGKMGIPDTILLKPGPLDDEEWKIMKKHPELAYNLLSGIPFLKDAVEIPYYHHERWDGSGYPHKLKGKDIPLSARIFAVVDVWDALTNDRPYRPAWSFDKAIEYLKENSEILFDPEIVPQFIKLIQE